MKKPNFRKLQPLFSSLLRFTNFIVLLTVYIFAKLIQKISSFRFFPSSVTKKFGPGLSSLYHKIVTFLDQNRQDTISRVDLIELSIRNMNAKRTRTYITIGGMMIGISTIVYLVSIGYGLQQLVISRVARLEELKQVDVSAQPGGQVKIDDKTLADFQSIPNVQSSLPLIAVVGRVNYQNSVSDMAVYGVTSDYLKQSAIKPVEGKIFDSNELTAERISSGQVAGATTDDSQIGSFDQPIREVEYAFEPGTWIRVRQSPSTDSPIIGYTKRTEGHSYGQETWGDSFASDDEAGTAGLDQEGDALGLWIKAKVPLWQASECDPETVPDCDSGHYQIMRDQAESQIQEEGYFAKINLTVTAASQIDPRVLGESTDSATLLTDQDSDTLLDSVDWVEIASEAGIITPPPTKTVEVSASAKRLAVVNRAMLQVLDIPENQAVGKTFTTSFVVVGDLLDDPSQKIESAPTEYTIVGVTPEERTPVFYVPFIDLRSLGITNYSQIKVTVKSQEDLLRARQQIESLGYVTTSVADTVNQINSLFSTIRTLLALLGMVALAVASLGMFNTLTVSLLERTREVGLMKAMGMKSSEVKELFLTESMIMGFFGGILGILVGFLLGKATGFILSIFAVFKGVGLIDITYLPFLFVLIVVLLSLLVGIITGIYPANRATKISALNALRYE